MVEAISVSTFQIGSGAHSLCLMQNSLQCLAETQLLSFYSLTKLNWVIFLVCYSRNQLILVVVTVGCMLTAAFL